MPAIAARLSVSPVTVRNHARRILSKLGTHSRLEPVARSFALGLVAPERISGS
jgi:DNA-binding NarL/FixJ family response regulator